MPNVYNGQAPVNVPEALADDHQYLPASVTGAMFPVSASIPETLKEDRERFIAEIAPDPNASLEEKERALGLGSFKTVAPEERQADGIAELRLEIAQTNAKLSGMIDLLTELLRKQAS